MTSTTGSTGDGIDLIGFGVEGGIAYPYTFASPNVAYAPGAYGWNTIIPNATGNLVAAAGPSAAYNGFYSDTAENGTPGQPDLELVSYPTPIPYTDQVFSTTSAAFSGTLTEVFSDSDGGYSELLDYYLGAAPVGKTGNIMTGYSASETLNPSGGQYDTQNYDIGTWQVVSFADLPSSLDNPPAAPEPRSWALAALVALAFLGICKLRLRSLDKSEIETPQLAS